MAVRKRNHWHIYEWRSRMQRTRKYTATVTHTQSQKCRITDYHITITQNCDITENSRKPPKTTPPTIPNLNSQMEHQKRMLFYIFDNCHAQYSRAEKWFGYFIVRFNAVFAGATTSDWLTARPSVRPALRLRN